MSEDVKKESLLPARAVQTFPPMTPQERTTAILLVLLYPHRAGKSNRSAAALTGGRRGPMLGAVRQTKEGSVMPEEKGSLPPLPPGHEDV